MATPSQGSPSTSSANFDMHQAEEMWKNFNRLSKWGMILVIIVLASMAMFLTGGHPPQP